MDAEAEEDVAVPAGATVRVGAVEGPGVRATLAVRGGLDCAPYLGSRSTFTLGTLGGHLGRALRAGDVVPIGDGALTAPGAVTRGWIDPEKHIFQLTYRNR